MKKYILTVTLNPAIDKAVYVPGFKVGHDFREQGISISAGGKGINVSQVLAHLNISNIATGFLGKNGATFIESELAKQKIKNSFVKIKGDVRTSLTIIDPAVIELTRILENGPRVTVSDMRKFKQQYRRLLNNAFAVILSGRNIAGAGDSFYGELINVAKKEGVKALFDTSGNAFPLGIKRKPFMIKPNVDEAEEYLKRRVRSQRDIISALKKFYDLGIKIVAITDGSRGAYVYDGAEIFFSRPPRIKRKSPVGCGDAFIAGFIAAYQKKNPLSECISLAVACGAANAASVNPGEIDAKAVRDILKNIKVFKKSTDTLRGSRKY
jgi:1-phosphofructokinase family hexose kinase